MHEARTFELNGEPLVLLHGGTGAGSDWRYVFDEPLEGYRTIVPDLRGHGRSTNPSGQLTIRQVAGDVLALMDRLGIECFKAMGMSLGAKTLLHVATAQPSRAVELYTAIPRAELWVVPNGGHGPIFGPRAPRFRETALEFHPRAPSECSAKISPGREGNRTRVRVLT